MPEEEEDWHLETCGNSGRVYMPLATEIVVLQRMCTSHDSEWVNKLSSMLDRFFFCFDKEEDHVRKENVKEASRQETINTEKDTVPKSM